MSSRRLLYAAAATLLALGAVAIATPRLLNDPRDPASPGAALETLDVYGTVPDFALVERSGRRVGRADLLGQVWVANFIFTNCTETCPTQSLEIARLQAEFTDARDLRFVSITVDPKHDTPEVLARYAERHGADPERWLFLTGGKRDIYCLADGMKLGAVDLEDPNPPACAATGARALRHALARLGPSPAWAAHGSQGLFMHSARLVLIDRSSRIRAYHLATDADSMKRLRPNLKTLLDEPAGRG